MSPANLFDHLNRPIRLGQKLGTGGEGAVFEVVGDSDLVAKVYHKAPPPRTAAKLREMVGLARDELIQTAAWPTAILHERPAGPTRGLIMRRIKNFKEIHTLYSPAQRKMTFPEADWKFLVWTAINCAAALENLHTCGVVIGDVNQSNVLVSDAGRIAFIDCDSFQIQANGQLYPCDVGVPLFTPPELQGQNFRGLKRTPNHDRFGLAILIFHLLFMGRHPFSGRFLGSAEMPIERAISEHRFAYGRSARSYEMQPPMHAPSLSAVSDQLVDLFERAFSREASQGNKRPTGADWHHALKRVLRTLRSCPADQGHVYASHLPCCPWCHLMKQGAPNFFISVASFRQGASRSGPVFVLATVWARIEQVCLPDLTYQPPMIPQGGRPAPLPPGIPNWTSPRPTPTNTLQRTIGIIALTFAPFLFAVKPIGAAFLAFAAGLVVIELMRKRELRLWDLATAPIRHEAEKRRRANTDAKQRLQAAEANWHTKAREYEDLFKTKRAELCVLRDRHESLAREYATERSRLQSKAREMQLNQFLQQQFISDADIWGIGPTRKATLVSFGVETAFDVKIDSIRRVPGFASILTGRLILWRQEIEGQFAFNPATGIPSQQQRAIDLKFAQPRKDIESKLLAGEGELQAIIKRAENELRDLYGHVQSCMQLLVQSELDLTVLPQGV